ncbi:GNAT family N-acetyltransferase [Polynucleobacter sp. CS-Odin-A6]|uniref:GNAT family N-acetyltransferase n=1 Tax=Polynucleobacter sp. CS-Odin-A6 TaxID=2689106 RepID=UPI001C0D92B2|nr:GNAT family N-acetyltransferase [Polynucleobacter sp. CS-Odin-A6]MBU3621044.1 GNAT family N-acetyltransferase [Polynucleobacter sp. CS-Odin-A6]
MKTSLPPPNKYYPLGEGKAYFIRPIQLDDKKRLIDLFNHLSPESRYLRFAHAIANLQNDFLENILHLDYKKEMALVAVIQNQHGDEEIIGISRYITLPKQPICEFSLSVSDSHTEHGVGTHLMLDLINHAKENGLKAMAGYVLANNSKMLHLVNELGFKVSTIDDDPDFKTANLPL